MYRNFIPDSGPLLHIATPQTDDGVRVDAGFITGDEVSSHYDPMIAKLIVQGPDRKAAIQKLSAALEDYEIAGPTTNVEFLKRICQHPAFIDGDVETGFIPKHHNELFREIRIPNEVYAQAALGTIIQEAATLRSTIQPNEIWQLGFTNSFQARQLRFNTSTAVGGEDVTYTNVDITQVGRSTYDLLVNGISYVGVESHWNPDTRMLTSYFPRTRLETRLIMVEDKLVIFQQGTQYRLQQSTPKWVEKALGIKEITNSVLAPMPCKILRVDVEQGDTVKKDQALVVIESMKMETVIRSPQDGVIARIVHRQGVSSSICDNRMTTDYNHRIYAKLERHLWNLRNEIDEAERDGLSWSCPGLPLSLL